MLRVTTFSALIKILLGCVKVRTIASSPTETNSFKNYRRYTDNPDADLQDVNALRAGNNKNVTRLSIERGRHKRVSRMLENDMKTRVPRVREPFTHIKAETSNRQTI